MQVTENTRTNSAIERIRVDSGQILVIDQFMFANRQFDALLALEEAENPPYSLGSLKSTAKSYGGAVVELEDGEYIVERFVQDSVITIAPDSIEEGTAIDYVSSNKENFQIVGSVFVDTRCVAILDAEKASSKETLSDYRDKRQKGGDKAGRDFIRKSGGAVRYGFNRLGDELGVFYSAEDNILALWPDVIESADI